MIAKHNAWKKILKECGVCKEDLAYDIEYQGGMHAALELNGCHIEIGRKSKSITSLTLNNCSANNIAKELSLNYFVGEKLNPEGFEVTNLGNVMRFQKTVDQDRFLIDIEDGYIKSILIEDLEQISINSSSKNAVKSKDVIRVNELYGYWVSSEQPTEPDDKSYMCILKIDNNEMVFSNNLNANDGVNELLFYELKNGVYYGEYTRKTLIGTKITKKIKLKFLSESSIRLDNDKWTYNKISNEEYFKFLDLIIKSRSRLKHHKPS